MKDRPHSCPTCTAQGLNAERFILDEFQIGDILYMDYIFPKTRQRLYMAEGYNQIVRWSDMSQGRPYACDVGWDCFLTDTKYTPLDMTGQIESIEDTAAHCQQRCVAVAGCAHF